VNEMRRLPRVVAETAIGKPADVVIWRDGKLRTLKVEVGELQEEEEVQATLPESKPPVLDNGAQNIPALGMKVAALSPAVRQRFELAEEVKGVVITEVANNGVAAEKGMQMGDVIVEVGQEKVNTPQDVVTRVDAARKAGRKSVLLLVENERGLRFVALRIDSK